MGITDYIRAKCDICGKEETFDGCGIQTPRATLHDNKWRTTLADSSRTFVFCPDCSFAISFYIKNLRGKTEDHEFETLGECHER